MRRAIPLFVFFALTGALLAQTATPAQSPALPLQLMQRQVAVPDGTFMSWSSDVSEGQSRRMKNVSFVFANGVRVFAEDALISPDKKTVEFSGKVRMTTP